MHPTEEILLGVASGDSDLPRRVLVEGHLERCPSCRATMAELTMAGGTLLRAMGGMGGMGGTAAAPRPDLLDGLMARVSRTPQPAAPAYPTKPGTPPADATATFLPLAPIAPMAPPAIRRPGLGSIAAAADPETAALSLPAGVLGEMPELATLRRIPWRWAMAPGAWYAKVAHDRAAHSVLLLGYLAPKCFLPAHEHLAQEDVLVLAGGFEDGQGRHEAGEYAVYEQGSMHRPVTEPDEGCWCLARLEKPNLLLGWRGWVQRLGQ